MSVKTSLNTAASRLFRVAVVVHFTCLYVLFFVMKNTLQRGSVQYNCVAASLSTLMLLIAVLFIVDMTTRHHALRRFSKVIDGAIGCVWITIVAVLISNSLRNGELTSAWVVSLVLISIVISPSVLILAKLLGRGGETQERSPGGGEAAE